MKIKCVPLILLLFASSVFAQLPAGDFRNSDDYKSARKLYQDLGGKDFANFDKRYQDHLLSFDVESPTERAGRRLSEAPGAFYELLARSFKEFSGLDPNRPASEQFFQHYPVYVPIQGYEKLNRDQRLVDHYHNWLFTRRILNAVAVIKAAHERAQVAIANCDEKLLRQAIDEIDFAVSELESVNARADEQLEQNNHQLNYYSQEMDWLEYPEEEIRGPQSLNIVEYLKLDTSMRELRKKGEEWQKLRTDINGRVNLINAWTDRIQKVKAYVTTNLPKIHDNVAKIRQAFENKCAKCGK